MQSRVIPVRMSQKKGAENDRLLSNPCGHWEKVVMSVFVLAVAVCLGLTVGALVHRTVTCLLWVVCGITPWILAFFLASLLKKTPERDEAAVAVADRLRQQAGEGTLGLPPPGSGPVGWLTRDGFYTSKGRLHPWGNFAGLHRTTGKLKSSGVRVHRLDFELLNDTSPRARLWNKGLLPLLGCSAVVAPSLEVYEVAAGLHRYGPRDDVLAAIAGAIMALCLLGISARLLFRQGWKLGIGGTASLLVDADDFPLGILADLIPERFLQARGVSTDSY